MLYAALFLCRRSHALHGYGVTGIERYVSSASLLTALGFAANTAAVAIAGCAGRPPFSNMYEMLLSFVWTLALLTLITEKAYKVKIIGSSHAHHVVSVILMQLLPSEVRRWFLRCSPPGCSARHPGHALLRCVRGQLRGGAHVLIQDNMKTDPSRR